jgi:hypothetical protein
MFKFIENWLNKSGFYKYSDLQVGGHCGCCGIWVKDEILPKYWAVTMCSDCIELGNKPGVTVDKNWRRFVKSI